jgi:PTH1 family peptidyl-tRNA hydrolase
MNSSGVAAKELVRDFRITPDSLVVVYDDCDLAPGRIRIRKSGGSGGHGGIASIIEALGTKDFPRLRVGIGRDPGRDLKEFVLTPFSADEKPAIEDAIERATLAIEAIITRGLDYAMNSFNREIRR